MDPLLVTTQPTCLDRTARTNRWLAAALLVLTAGVYAPVRHHAFITLDDPIYVTQHRYVKEGLAREGFVWAWSHPHVATWNPLTTLSHMLDCTLFGLRPGPHHVVNLVLHVLNTLLLFGVLAHMTAQPYASAFVAGLFALHPLHVESVAWVVERRDVLSTCFWMLSLCAYVGYVGRPSARRYTLLLAAYIAALLSKPMVVTLPFVLLLLDVWPLRRIERPRVILLEKLPLMLLAAVVSFITFVVQRSAHAMDPGASSPLTERVANALVSYAAYLAKMLWPSGLAVFYPFEAQLPLWQVCSAALLLVVVTALAVWRARRQPYLLVGWLWYLGTLVPVIGLVRIGSHAMADRFTYVPLIGIFIIVAWGVPDLLRRWGRADAVCAAGAVAALAACIVTTSRQLAFWQDSVHLFEHAVSVTRNNSVARINLVLALQEQGRRQEALSVLAEMERTPGR